MAKAKKSDQERKFGPQFQVVDGVPTPVPFPPGWEQHMRSLNARVEDLEERLARVERGGPVAGPDLEAGGPPALELPKRLDERLSRIEQEHDRALYQVQVRIGTFPWEKLSNPPAEVTRAAR